MSYQSDLQLIAEFESWALNSRNLSPKTVALYVRALHMFIDWLADPPSEPLARPATSATGFATAVIEDLERFSGIYLHSLGMQACSRRPFVSALRTFYKYCLRYDHCANAAEHLKPPKIGQPLPIPLTPDQVEKLFCQPDIKTFMGLRDLTIMAVLAGTGIRVSGLRGLHDEDVVPVEDPDTGISRWVIRVREKGRKDRLVPLPPETQQLLQAYMAHEQLDEADRRSELTGKMVLFVNQWNSKVPKDKWYGEARRLQISTIQTMLSRYAKKACLDVTAHPHAWRHFYGTELVENDVDVTIRSVLMGHSDPKHTMMYEKLAMRKLFRKVDQGNPLQRISAPVVESARQLSRAGRSGRR